MKGFRYEKYIYETARKFFCIESPTLNYYFKSVYAGDLKDKIEGGSYRIKKITQ